jgi:hypothetical protein
MSNATLSIGTLSLTDAVNVALENAKAPSLPESKLVRRGKAYVRVQTFGIKHGSAAEIRAALVEANPDLSTKKRESMVRETLYGEKTIREQLMVAHLMGSLKVATPSHSEETANIITYKLMKDKQPKAIVKTVVVEKTPEEVVNGMSAEQLAGMLTLLQAKIAGATAAPAK